MNPKVFIGPMSLNIVNTVIDFCEYKNINIGLIPSRRQVEYLGGYVNEWTTKEFCDYVRSKTHKVLLVRDHAGPLQGNTDDDGYMSLAVDSCTFDVIHVDIWKKFSNLNDACHHTSEYIKFCHKINSNLLFEIGTEEAIRKYEAEDLDTFLTSLRSNLGYIFSRVQYGVIQSGTALRATGNVGTYNNVRLKEMIKVCKKHGLISKEHNGDYLENDLVKNKFDNGLETINIAPEFGNIETKVLLENMNDRDFETFYQVCKESNRWRKWVSNDFNPDENKLEIVNITGHYVFSDPRIVDLKKNMNSIDHYICNRLWVRLEELVDLIYG